MIRNLWQKWRTLRRPHKLLTVVILLMCVGGVGIYFWLFAGLPSIDNLRAGLALPSTRIYDRKGRLLYEIIDPQGGRNTAIPLAQIPAACVQATIATEDRNFYSNPGVDLAGIVRALWINLRGGEVRAGGSTITQQVARNLLLDPGQRAERTITRKLREIVLALQLNGRYSRDEVLALYLNQTYYGNLAYGIQAAAQVYFGKDAAALDLAECAMLAGLPQAPAIYDPLTEPETSNARQKVVLRLMTEAAYLTTDQAESAGKQPLQYSARRFPIEAPHFVMTVWEQIEQRYPDQVYRGGLEVRTTLDLDWQHTAELLAQRNIDRLNNPPPGEMPHNATNAALVALDPKTGQVLALVGSVDYFNERIGGSINMALAPRQPGSTLKPFTYALTFDPTRPDVWTPATMLLDVRTPFVTRRLESYTPANYAQVEHGPVSIREALASSYNIPAVVALDHVGVGSLLSLLQSLGIRTLGDEFRYDLALTLGGGEVRLVELTAAYAAFARAGVPVAPEYILDVKDKDGTVLYEWQPPQTSRDPVIDPRVAFLINDILSDNEARLPSFGGNSALQIARVAAAKTGTTTDFRDNWTMGYTPGLVVGVWVGNADNTPMVNVSGVTGAGPLWNDFMRAILQNTPEEGFAPPPGVRQAEVCALSGLLPTPLCPRTRLDWFIDGTTPTRPDNVYQKYTIDRATGLLADKDTPPDRRVERVYAVLPQEARDWAFRNGIPQPPGTVSTVGARPGSAATFRILSPDPYTIFQLAPQTPYENQQIRFTAAVPEGAREVRYSVDGKLVGSATEAPYAVWWPLAYGQHAVTATVTLADGTTQTSAVIQFSVTSFVPAEQRPTSGDG
jgi:penicillin-binding protein 1C